MKWKFIRQILIMSQYALFGIFIQALIAGVLLAEESKSQKLSEIYISIEAEEEPLKYVLSKIERKTDFRFFYNDGSINVNERLSLDVKYQSLYAILSELSKEKQLGFKRIDNSIFISNKKITGVQIEESFTEPKQQTVSGTVMSTTDNEPLPGVSILVKGTSTGTTTNLEGKFSINALPEDILIFSYIGYLAQEITVGNQTTLNISMNEDLEQLEEVVVTALGIGKESRSLGYSTATVKPEEFAVNRTPNFTNALTGKIAGVNVSSLGTGAAGSSKIRIRGQSSISGQNNPLIVIDGVPIDNTNFGTNPRNSGSDNSQGISPSGGGITSDGGDGLLSINPDDIESLTVLKGAAAAALYGSRAKDGVILISMKKKGDKNGIGITYNLNYTNESPLDFTDYQYEYGQGERGVRPTSPNPTSGQWSFGERFEPGMTQILFDGVEVPYVPIRDRIDIFYRNGNTLTNTVSLTANNDNGGLRVSFSDLYNEGIIPNNKYNRKTINLGFDYRIHPKVKFFGTINYSNEDIDNPPNVGNQDNTIPVSVAIMSNSMPWDLLEEKKFNADGNEFVYSRFRNRTNPYWVLSEQFNNIVRDRVFGNVGMRFDLAPWIYIQGRIGQDYWSRDQDVNNQPTGKASLGPAPAGFVNGRYYQESRRFRELNTDLLIGLFKEFGDFTVDANIGGNQLYRRRDINAVSVRDFVIRDLYTVQNGRVKDPVYSLNERKVNSIYGSAGVAYKEMLYLNGTLRNDWFSTLAPDERSILYPSVSTSFVFTEILPENKILNFGKLRLAYAEVGSDTDVSPYSNSLFYNINANLFNNQPVGSIQGSRVANPLLRPMRVSEIELGFELDFLDNRLGLDIAYFQKNTTDQIVSAEISRASGFASTLINSGESRVRGVEFLFDAVPIETGNFRWNFSFNGSYIKTKVLKLLTDEEGENIRVGRHLFNGFLHQEVGLEMGQIRGFGFKRDAQGRQVFGDNGIALRTDELINFGSALPDWVGGFTNSFTYNDLRFSFLVDFKLGNKMLSGTNFNAIRHGLHKMTVPGRENEYMIIGDGVDSEGNVNTVAANVQPYWEVIRSQQLIEPAVYNGGFWKLRQITLGYDLTKLVADKLPIQGLTIDLIANNVLILKKWVPNIDPEVFGFTSDNLVGMESTGVPTTRNIGFNLNMKF